MDDIDRRVIQIYAEVLANETNFNDLFRELSREDNIITSNLRNKYKLLQEKEATNYSLNRELYKDIQTRGKSAFNVLIQCLSKIHPDLVELLLPSERIAVSANEEGETLNQNEPDRTEHQGLCTVKANKQNKSEVISAAQKLCNSIRAEYVSNDRYLTETKFHIAINADGKFKEEDINHIEQLYTNKSDLQIILINIKSEEIDNSTFQPTKMNRGSSDCSPAVYIVNILIHEGDHSPSVISIINEVVSHNPGFEIRDIFRVVMEKLAKWGCRLNTESRNFPKFYF